MAESSSFLASLKREFASFLASLLLCPPSDDLNHLMECKEGERKKINKENEIEGFNRERQDEKQLER
jgi:hypothetical protein